MTYIVGKPNGRWEIRESRNTETGPRSRTLATFNELTPEVVELARGRSSKPLQARSLREAARRAGAPVQSPVADRAAAELLSQLAAGRRPRSALARLLADALEARSGSSADNARAAVDWVGASPRRRGEALHDLLLLTDSLPASAATRRARFPRIESAPA